jgi:hypothetical protein
MRYEIRFYDPLDHVKVAVELTAADRHAAEHAAKLYLGDEAPMRLLDHRLSVGVVRELS